MRAPNLAVIVVALIVGALVVLLAIGSAPRQPAETRTASAAPSSVTGNGFTLTSSSVAVPADEATFPPGPNVDLVNQRCLACHSASMARTQPPLKPEQWKAIVEKMRDVYHAPMEPGDVPAIVDYFATRAGA